MDHDDVNALLARFREAQTPESVEKLAGEHRERVAALRGSTEPLLAARYHHLVNMKSYRLWQIRSPQR